MATSEGAAMRGVVGFNTLNNDNGGTGPKQVGTAVSPLPPTETPEDPVVDGDCRVSGVVAGTPPPSGSLFV